MDWPELAILALFGAVSCWVIGLDLWWAATKHLAWTGIDGVFPVDQFQYLAWINDASHHVLASDLFVLRTTPHDFLQPMVTISGGLTALGVTPWLSLLVWKPVAVVGLFFALSAYCGRLLQTPAQRYAAILLGLFAATYKVPVDEWLPFLSWGYPFVLVSLATLLATLITYGRCRARGSLSPAPLVFGALTAWLHPWQGEMLLVMLALSEIWRVLSFARAGHSWVEEAVRPLRILAPVVLATLLPLVYYGALGQFDPAWQIGKSALQVNFKLGSDVRSLVPLMILAIPAYFRRPAGFLDVTVRVWPLATLLVWAVNETPMGSWAIHVWIGITIPLAVLAVQGTEVWGFRRIPHHRWVAGLVVAALIVPGSIVMLRNAQHQIEPRDGHNGGNLIIPSEHRALQFLAASNAPGSVLAMYPLGDMVPAVSGRNSYYGDGRWTPGFEARNSFSWNLLHGFYRWHATREFIRRSHIRFVVASCPSHKIARILRPMLVSVHRFGCLTIFHVS